MVDIEPIEDPLNPESVLEQVALLGHPLLVLRQSAAAKLVSLGVPIVPMLCGILLDPRSPQREQVARVLAEIGDASAAESLIAALKDTHAGVRRQCAAALGGMQYAAAVGALTECCRDRSFPVAAAAVAALGEIGGAEAVTALATLLHTAERESLLTEICQALAAIGTDAALEHLLSLLRSRNPESREAGISGLVLVRNPEVTPHLDEALASTLSTIHSLIEESYFSPKGELALAVHEKEFGTIASALSSFVTFRTSGALADGLQSPSITVRKHCALAFAAIAERDPDPRLIQVVQRLKFEFSPWAFHSAANKQVFRQAQARIEAALFANHNLPLPHSGDPAGSSSLPRPSDSD